MTSPPVAGLGAIDGSIDAIGESDGAWLAGAGVAGAVVAAPLLHAVKTMAAAAVRRMGRNFTGLIS